MERKEKVKKPRWTPERVEELGRLKETMTIDELAARYGVTRIGMYNTLRQHGYGKSRKVRVDRSPLGTLRTRKDGMVYIMTDKGWIYYTAYLWAQAGRTVPPNHKLCIRDKSQPITLDNLEVKSMKEIAAISAVVRSGGVNPFCKTAEKIAEQEERRLKRIEEKRAKAEAKQRQKEERQAAGYRMTPARLAHLEKVRQVRMAKAAERRKQEEEVKRRREAEKEQLRVEKEWKGRKRDINRLSPIQRDFSTVRWVQVDKRTRIELKEGQTPEEVIRKYSKQAA